MTDNSHTADDSEDAQPDDVEPESKAGPRRENEQSAVDDLDDIGGSPVHRPTDETEASPEGVVSPDEVPSLDDLAADDRVSRLDETRFVVSMSDDDGAAADDTTTQTTPGTPSTDAHARADESRDAPAPSEITPPAARASARPEPYVLSVAAKTDHGVAEHTFASDDIREPFSDFLYWYASQVEPSRDPDEVLAVLLRHAAVDVEY